MRVLDLTLFYPPQAGGAVTTTLEFIRALLKKGYEVEVLAPSKDEYIDSLKLCNDEINELNDDRIVHRIRLPRKFKKWTVCYSYWLYALKKLRTKKFDLILAHFHFNTGMGWTAFLLSKLIKCPYYIRIHDIYKPITFKHKVLFFVNKTPLKKCEKILVINEVSKQLLVSSHLAPAHKIEVVPNGVSDIEPRNTIKRQKRKVGFIGAISGNRGFELLIPVLQEVKKTISDIEFHLVGDGPKLKDICMELQKHEELKGNLYIHGALAREKALSIVADMDLCLGLLGRSYNNEYQLLIKLIESIHLGIPWISVNTKGVHEFNQITQSGIVVNEDARELADAIVTLLTDNAGYEEKVKNCRLNRHHYDWENIAVKLDLILREQRRGSHENIRVHTSY
ncbi:glycosyltransferase family 4 protein [Paenibacillus cisolokensis]|uniref:glycosyltransferase family 4 protein n=1 Tax=Paenibacillus cisolokensis TaxID=1658519 RepID=UPI003D2A4896